MKPVLRLANGSETAQKGELHVGWGDGRMEEIYGKNLSGFVTVAGINVG